MATSSPLRLISAAPRSHLFTRATTSSRHSFSRTNIRTLSTTRHFNEQSTKSAFPFTGPSPPRLPKEDQDLFEALQRQSTGAFSTPRAPPQINQSPDSSGPDRAEAAAEIENRTDKMAGAEHADSQFKQEYERVIEAKGKGEELHPAVRRGARPEFEGDVNPKTGEVGGPKNEPLRWGASSEWTYNGRATDF